MCFLHSDTGRPQPNGRVDGRVDPRPAPLWTGPVGKRSVRIDYLLKYISGQELNKNRLVIYNNVRELAYLGDKLQIANII